MKENSIKKIILFSFVSIFLYCQVIFAIKLLINGNENIGDNIKYIKTSYDKEKIYEMSTEKNETLNFDGKNIYDLMNKIEREDYLFRHSSIIASTSIINDETKVFLKRQKRVNIDNGILKNIKAKDIVRVYNTYSDSNTNLYIKDKKFIDFKYIESIPYCEIWEKDFPYKDHISTSKNFKLFQDNYYTDRSLQSEYHFGDLVFRNKKKLFLKFEYAKGRYVYVNPYSKMESDTHYMFHYEPTDYGDNVIYECKFFVQDVVSELNINNDVTYNVSYYKYDKKIDKISPYKNFGLEMENKEYSLKKIINKKTDLTNYFGSFGYKQNAIPVSYISIDDNGNVNKLFFHDFTLLFN